MMSSDHQCVHAAYGDGAAKDGDEAVMIFGIRIFHEQPLLVRMGDRVRSDQNFAKGSLTTFE